jgi:hypothetical protein
MCPPALWRPGQLSVDSVVGSGKSGQAEGYAFKVLVLLEIMRHAREGRNRVEILLREVIGVGLVEADV